MLGGQILHLIVDAPRKFATTGRTDKGCEAFATSPIMLNLLGSHLVAVGGSRVVAFDSIRNYRENLYTWTAQVRAHFT